MLNSYIRPEHNALPHHILFTGLEDASRVINGVSRLEVTPRETFAETPLTLIPSYPDLPMEKVYPRTMKTDISCLYLRQTAGRVAYFPFDIDRTFWEVLCADHLKLLRNTVLWANTEAPVVEVQWIWFPRCHRVAKRWLYYDPSRQSHQPHDDEGAISRLLPYRRTDGQGSSAQRRSCQSCTPACC